MIGNERAGLAEDELALMDDCVEIPVWGLPYSYNVATATAMALYEYCRQYPSRRLHRPRIGVGRRRRLWGTDRAAQRQHGELVARRAEPLRPRRAERGDLRVVEVVGRRSSVHPAAA